MKLLATRLQAGDDLRRSIVKFTQANRVSSGVIVSAVGSLSAAVLRMAGARPDKQDAREYGGAFEIVSLTGTVTADGETHLHMSVADENGQVFGGHVKDGCIVHTTVELAIGAEDSLRFGREIDNQTGFDELVVSEVSKNGD